MSSRQVLYIYIYIYTHTHIYIDRYMCVHVYVHVYVCVYVSKCVCVCVCIYEIAIVLEKIDEIGNAGKTWQRLSDAGIIKIVMKGIRNGPGPAEDFK